MAGLDKNVLFCLNGESFEDSSYNKIAITNNNLTEANIIDEEIDGHPIKCIDFNTTNGYLSFNLDDNFFNGAWTIDWWEKDGDYTSLSGLFTNMVTSSGNYFGIGRYQSGTNTFVNMASSGSYFINTQAVGNDKVGEWVHRAIVFNGVDKYDFYENGTLFKTTTNTKKAYNGKSAFQMGKWRATTTVLNRKVYNFRVSNIARYTEDFTPEVKKYEKESISIDINIDNLLEGATLVDISNKIKEIKEANNLLTESLKEILTSKGIEVEENDKLKDLISKVNYI